VDYLGCARNFVSLSCSCVSSEEERVVTLEAPLFRFDDIDDAFLGLHAMKNQVL